MKVSVQLFKKQLTVYTDKILQGMEDKLDKVISLLTNLIEKFDALYSKVEKLSKKTEIFEETVNDKFAQVDKEL